MKKTMMFGVLGMMLCAIGAQAQTTPATDAAPQKPITIKLGAFFPSNGDTKNLGKTWFAAGAEYAFAKPGTSLLPLAYVDYTGKSKDLGTILDDGAGNTISGKISATSIGVGVGVRGYASTTGAITPFYGAGLGVYFDQVKVDGSGTGLFAKSASVSKNKTNLGFKLNAGVEFQRMYFVEAAYTNPGKVDLGDGISAKLEGFDLLVGARF